MSLASITEPHFSGVYNSAIKMCSGLRLGTQGLSSGAEIHSFNLKEKKNEEPVRFPHSHPHPKFLFLCTTFQLEHMICTIKGLLLVRIGNPIKP